ncbi:MAG: amidohydrolase family protein, partial [Thermoanaerobaculia bacterium]
AETFAIDDGVARWKNRTEHGSAPSRPPRFYSSATSPLDETRALVLAARAAKDACIDLLPTGRACVRKALEDRVTAGGREQTIHAWAISGVGFRPVIVWLDEQSELFATVSSWASAIREGWESAEEGLLEKQEAWIAGELRRRTQASARKPSGPFVIRNAKLFDSVSGAVRAGMSVVVSGKRILRVAPDEELHAAGAEVIDARGAMLLPGLWDMHVHDLPANGLLALASGVTTVRSLGGRSESLVPMRSKFESGAVAGPRLMFHGLIDGRNGSTGVSGELVDDAPGVVRAVATYLEAGADGIKIYSAVPPTLVPQIVDEAHARGLAAGGHVPTGMSVQDAVLGGLDEISHLWSIIGGFEAPMPDAETPAGKREMARRLIAFDVMSPAVQAFLRQLRVRHVTVDPTIGSFEDSLGGGGIVNGEDPVHGVPVAAHLPPAVRRSAAALHQVRTIDGATQAVAIQKLRSLLMELRRHGVSLVLGGDGLPGLALQREMAEWAASGVPNAEILQAATLGNARAAGREKFLGSIQPGKLADMVLVDGNPVANIRDIVKVRLTIKDGTIYEPRSLLENLGVEH